MISLSPPGLLPWGHLQGTQKKLNHLGHLDCHQKRGQVGGCCENSRNSPGGQENGGNSLGTTLEIVLISQLFISEL